MRKIKRIIIPKLNNEIKDARIRRTLLEKQERMNIMVTLSYYSPITVQQLTKIYYNDFGDIEEFKVRNELKKLCNLNVASYMTGEDAQAYNTEIANKIKKIHKEYISDKRNQKLKHPPHYFYTTEYGLKFIEIICNHLGLKIEWEDEG